MARALAIERGFSLAISSFSSPAQNLKAWNAMRERGKTVVIVERPLTR